MLEVIIITLCSCVGLLFIAGVIIGRTFVRAEKEYARELLEAEYKRRMLQGCRE